MLGRDRPRRTKLGIAQFFLWLGLAVAACTGESAEAPATEISSTTTTTEAAVAVERITTLRVGIVVNEAAPTADLDARIVRILNESSSLLSTADSPRIELTTVSVETVGQADGSILALLQDGISVIITGCDDATVPAVLEAATSNELLAVTGCVALPRPDIAGADTDIDPSLFVDLSSLADNSLAIEQYSLDQGHDSLGVIRSTLLPDVEQTCIDLEAQLPEGDDEDAADTVGTGLAAATTFAELIDAPDNVVADFASSVDQTTTGTIDAIVVCALPPSVGDIVQALREAGFDEEVIVPWYGDTQSWSADTTNVVTLSPASRHGDDPEGRTNDLFDAVTVGDQSPNAVDVVTADTLAILVDAVLRTGSVGSRSLAETISGDAVVNGISGPIETVGSIDFPLRRSYRVIAINDGVATFATLASTLESEAG